MRLGLEVKLDGILRKFASVYGVVESIRNLLDMFYSVKQKPYEDVTTWSCQLEAILSMASEKGIVNERKPTLCCGQCSGLV